MKDKEITIEQFVVNLLEQEHGKLRDEVSDELRNKNKSSSIEVMNSALTTFIENPSFVNWNMMITAMATYQWWMQKKTYKFDLEADF